MIFKNVVSSSIRARRSTVRFSLVTDRLHGMQEASGSNPDGSTGMGASMNMKQMQLPAEHMKELEKYGKKCSLTPKEKQTIAELSAQLSLSPARIIETIALNASGKEDRKGWEISNLTITQYERRLEAYRKQHGEAKRKLEESKNKSGIFSALKRRWLEGKLSWTEKTVKRYENIIRILETARKDDALVEKIKKRSGFKTLDEML